jgi:hypothetical protein
MASLIEAHPESPLPIDDDLKVEGLKNPIYLVIIGFSGTKVLETARKSGKDIQSVLIIEPSLSVFHQTMKRQWVGDLAKSEDIDLLVGINPDEMLPHIYKIFTHVDKKTGNRASRCMQPEIVVDPFAYPAVDGKPNPIAEQITKIVVDASKQVFLAMGCASDSYFRWEQMIRNESNLQNSYRIAPLYGKFWDLPVVVAGAGPSLEDFIHAYHDFDLKDRCLIVACDAALVKLQKHGIRPDIVTRCERKLTTIFRDVRPDDTRDVFYAAYPWTPPEYFSLFPNSFMLFRDNGVCKWSGYDPGAVNGGVSSANAAFELAYLLGAKEIILTGVDLCFLEGKSHIEGTEVEFDIEKSKPKWTEIQGNAGKVTTIPVWNRCLNEYRTTIFKHEGKAKVYNTSLKGAKIEGTEVRPWNALAEIIFHGNKPAETPLTRLKKYLEKHPVGYEHAFRNKKIDTVKYLRGVQKDLEKLFGNVTDSLLIARREEEKILRQLQSYTDPEQYFQSVNAVKKQLTQIYQEPCRQIDQFKSRYYTQDMFSIILLDICQLDVFQTENKSASLKNQTEIEHDRLKLYAHHHMTFFKTLHYYAEQIIHLLEKGPKKEVDYTLAQDAYEC